MQLETRSWKLEAKCRRYFPVSSFQLSGSNFLPGLQATAQRLMFAGPQAMASMFETKPGYVHVENAIIDEFELAP